MKKEKVLLSLAISCIATTTCLAQNIIGKIIDTHHAPVPFANVVLINQQDSTFIQGTVSQEDGSFSLEGTPHKNELVKVSYVGHQTKYIPCNQAQLGDIILPLSSKQLDEVVVKGQLPKFELNPTGLTTNVSGTLLSTIGTANDILNRIPGVSGSDGSFHVFGKGTPLIYINGRVVRNTSELAQLDASDIQKVELINNPGAKYGAENQAVIIIRTKRKQGDGLSGIMQATAGVGYKPESTQYVSLNYRYHGLDVFANAYLYQKTRAGEQKMSTTQWMGESDIIVQDMDIDFVVKPNYYRGEAGFNYEFNENHRFGAKYILKATPYQGTISDQNTKILNGSTTLEHFDLNMLMDIESVPNHAVSAYYNGKIGRLGIQWDVDFLSNTKDSDTHTLEVDRMDSNNTTQVDRTSGVESELYASKLVLSYPVWKGALQVGHECTDSRRNNTNLYKTDLIDDARDKIEENTYAGFAQYQAKYGKVQFGLGVRYEHTAYDYYEDGVHFDSQSKKFVHFYPNASLSFPINNLAIQLSYSEKTNRPSYHQLRSGISYNNKYLYETGNPFLKPTRINDLSLMAMYKDFQFMANYIHKTDAIIFDNIRYEKNPDILLVKPFNADKVKSVNIMGTYTPKFDWWNPTLSVGVSKQFFDKTSMEEHYNLNNPMGQFSLQNRFTLPKDYILYVDGRYNTAGHTENIYMRPSGRVDIALNKSFLNNQLRLRIKANDIFATGHNKFTNYCQDAVISADNYYYSRSLSLAITYTFNKTRSKYKGKGAGKAEKRRM